MADADAKLIPATDSNVTAKAVAGRSTGSLVRRMIGIAALWISLLLLGGGLALLFGLQARVAACHHVTAFADLYCYRTSD